MIREEEINSAYEYFLLLSRDFDNRGSDDMKKIYSRITRALHLYGNLSLKQLCAMTEKELKRIRGIGDKSREVIMDECLLCKRQKM